MVGPQGRTILGSFGGRGLKIACIELLRRACGKDCPDAPQRSAKIPKASLPTSVTTRPIVRRPADASVGCMCRQSGATITVHPASPRETCYGNRKAICLHWQGLASEQAINRPGLSRRQINSAYGALHRAGLYPLQELVLGLKTKTLSISFEEFLVPKSRPPARR